MKTLNKSYPLWDHGELQELKKEADKLRASCGIGIWLRITYKSHQGIFREYGVSRMPRGLYDKIGYAYVPVSGYIRPPTRLCIPTLDNRYVKERIEDSWKSASDKWDLERLAERIALDSGNLDAILQGCPDIHQICCFGLGTMDEPLCFLQHIAVKNIAQAVARVRGRVRLILQESMLTDGEMEFIKPKLGDGDSVQVNFTDDPDGFLAITHTTLVITFNPKFPVRQIIEGNCAERDDLLPAAIICAPSDVEDTAENGDKSSCRVKAWLNKYKRHEFTSASSDFGHTCLHTSW